MNIDSIKNGFVIDHIKAGNAMAVYQYLNLGELDVLYMTRVQKERFFNEADYIRLRDSYILTPEKLETAKKDLTILHPLPRVNEISTKIDDDPRACYFKQVLNGKYARMALILKLLEID